VFVSITGIEEISALDDMNIFPNPNDGTFVIHFNTRESSERLHVRIVNALGQIVYEDTDDKFNGSYSKKVQLSDKTSGVYHVTLYTDTKAYKKTISKQ
jgi:hypothetical protein